MSISRRTFVKNGVAAFTVGFAVPQFLTDLARAQGSSLRSLIVLEPERRQRRPEHARAVHRSNYYSRRPTLAVPAGTVLQVGTTRAARSLGLHPKLTGLKDIFNSGRLALIQRVGYENSSRRISTAPTSGQPPIPANGQGSGWLGRYLSTLGATLDPLRRLEHDRRNPTRPAVERGLCRLDSEREELCVQQPQWRRRVRPERSAAVSIASHVPVDRPHVAFVTASAQSAMATLDTVAAVGRTNQA
jgi:uncharacterized protein (DUF1501 family)